MVVGSYAVELDGHFRDCRVSARVRNAAGIDNDERGARIYLCAGTRAPWSRIWDELSHLG